MNDGLEPVEAREHLEMVDRILAGADRQVRLMPAPFIAFGIAGGLFDIASQRIFFNHSGWWPAWIAMFAWAAAIAITIISARRLRRKKSANARWTLLDSQMYTLFNIVWIATLALAFSSQPHIFGQWAAAAIWSFAYGIALVFAGTQGNRYVFVGGVVLLASIVVANYAYPFTGYVLAAGMWIGMAGCGVALYFTQRQ
ncbi:MAG: hypothetical protein M3Y21_09425 [Candidatus Eremiobacteraeota bacterium]|nr:hypothetical protein [Candidatus Eremiobacteraeota bacterium]